MIRIVSRQHRHPGPPGDSVGQQERSSGGVFLHEPVPEPDPQQDHQGPQVGGHQRVGEPYPAHPAVPPATSAWTFGRTTRQHAAAGAAIAGCHDGGRGRRRGRLRTERKLRTVLEPHHDTAGPGWSSTALSLLWWRVRARVRANVKIEIKMAAAGVHEKITNWYCFSMKNLEKYIKSSPILTRKALPELFRKRSSLEALTLNTLKSKQ